MHTIRLSEIHKKENYFYSKTSSVYDMLIVIDIFEHSYKPGDIFLLAFTNMYFESIHKRMHRVVWQKYFFFSISGFERTGRQFFSEIKGILDLNSLIFDATKYRNKPTTLQL